MCILKGFSRLILGFDVQDGFLCESLSFENCCIKESYFVLWYFGRERYCRMEIVSFFNKKFHVFAVIVPKGENVINVMLPFSWLGVTLMANWSLIKNQPQLKTIFGRPPIISYKRGKSLKHMLVGAKCNSKAFDNATQPQNPHWESVQVCLWLPFKVRVLSYSKERDNLFQIRNELWRVLLLLFFLSGVDISLQVTLVDSQYLPDYEKLNSEPAQELISKFVAEVIIISHKPGI